MAKELFDLGGELSHRLIDFCEASYGARKARVVREALSNFIDDRLAAEPELRKRYEEARTTRLRGLSKKVHVLRSEERGHS